MLFYTKLLEQFHWIEKHIVQSAFLFFSFLNVIYVDFAVFNLDHLDAVYRSIDPQGHGSEWLQNTSLFAARSEKHPVLFINKANLDQLLDVMCQSLFIAKVRTALLAQKSK